MKMPIKRTRIFGGKRYGLISVFMNKSIANKTAKKIRAKGKNARVVSFKDGRKTKYAIYISKRKRQGYNARMDESLGMRRGASRTKSQSMKSRRDESKGMSKSMGRRAYASVRSMDKGRRTRR